MLDSIGNLISYAVLNLSMKNGHVLIKSTFHILLLTSVSLFLSHCNKSTDPFSIEDKQTSNNESTQESTTNELDDIGTSILNSSPISGSPGRVTTLDDRYSCDGTTIVFSNVSADNSSGTVTLTFPPDGCADKKGNVRKGSIVINWSGGRWYKVGSVHSVTLNDYSINDVAISGSQTEKCIAFKALPLCVTWTIKSSHKATWPDGSSATRNVNKIRKWDHTATEDTYTVTNGTSSNYSAEGTNRHGRTFKVYITSPLVYLGSCAKANKVFIPVKGEKVITVIGSTGTTKSLTIDFGNGSCDNTYTVTSGTTVRILTAKNDSSGD